MTTHYTLPKSEATVVILLVSDEGEIRVIPLWECEMSSIEVTQYAINAALVFNEELGHGSVTATIDDRRLIRG